MKTLKIKETPTLDIYSLDTSTVLELPFVKQGISAGFPSPAQDYLDETLDLNKALIKNKESTFCGRVRGNSMRDAGMDDGDVLIIDKSLDPKDGVLAVCYLNGNFTVKRIKIIKGEVYLTPENKDYQPIKVEKGSELIIWGIVTFVIKKTR